MRTLITLWRKEFLLYFLSPMAYVTTIFFLVIMGFSFWLLAALLVQGPAGTGALEALFDSLFFWIAILVVVPVITMRMFSDEKRTGTIELLMTAPVTDVEVVLAKYLAALSFYLFMWLPTLAYVFILHAFSPLTAPLDPGPILGGYLGALLVGAFYLAIGLFASSLTSNQIVAAMISFALFGLFFFSGLLSYVFRGEMVQNAVGYISALSHLEQFARGSVDTRPVVLYVSGAVFMLFATVKVVESRKWK